MSIFIITFLLIYSGMHVYVFLKARAAFSIGAAVGIPLAFFFGLMIMTPFIVRISERQGLEVFARTFSLSGYLWMGFVLLFCSVLLASDSWRFILFSSGLIFKKSFAHFSPAAGHAFTLSLFLALSAAAYGYYDALQIRTERITIRTPKLPENIGKLTVVQISDVHVGLIIREERLRRIVRAIDDIHPDILISTGDLVDGQLSNLKGLAVILNSVKTRFGKFAITGNHEYYAGLDQALDFTKSSGFTVLRGEGVTVNNMINIAGVDDSAGINYHLPIEISEKKMLADLPRELFTLFMKHRPLVDKNAIGFFDLQVSGHVHKGQIFPFSLLTKFYYPVYAGFAELGGGSSLYVSRGTGTWGPPIRFLAPPEIAVIEIISSSEN